MLVKGAILWCTSLQILLREVLLFPFVYSVLVLYACIEDNANFKCGGGNDNFAFQIVGVKKKIFG